MSRLVLSRNLVVLLVLFVALHAATRAQDKYERSALWEKEINAFKEADAKTPPKKKGVLLVGSSSMRAWRTAAEDLPGLDVLNRGFGGSHIEDINHYFSDVVLPYEPKLIVFYAGENDLTAGKTVDRVHEDFEKFIALVHRHLPKSRLIFVSLKPSPARWHLRESFQQLNQLVKADTAKDKRMLYVDIWAAMLDKRGEPKRELFLGDQLHMKLEGYVIWRAKLRPHIEAGLKGDFRR
jgi:lysophospholipase L1-like esterase